MRYLIFVSLLFLASCADFPIGEEKSSVQGTLAPKPLYRDPIYDGAADPSIIFNAAEKKWLMFYTNRRANITDLTHVTWVHGTPIGIAESTDGANWSYRGRVNFPNDIPDTQNVDIATYWAPAVLEHEGIYHMYITIVPGVFEDWNHPRTIVHLTSRDLNQWQYQSRLPLINNKVIDPCVLRLPDGSWRLWYNNEPAGKKTFYAESKDLYHWEDKGSANLPEDRGEAPLVFFWQGHYWLINDLLGNNGLGVYKSDDALGWFRQKNNLLDLPGTGVDDNNAGHHPEVIVSGDRAYLFYFVHPGSNAETVYDKQPDINLKRSSIQVVELQYSDGWITADRNAPVLINLLPAQKK
jgi:hypothetical protein